VARAEDSTRNRGDPESPCRTTRAGGQVAANGGDANPAGDI
jgi:hypothetical protein